ncbi:MAG: trigger factor [Candidatus Dadabacteria bacterium]|nr:MAG: trigger factor [Candidatus Dadabacteria bacterium]
MADFEATVEERGPVRRVLSVTVSAERVAREFDRAYRRLGQRVRVPGFRPGKVPRRVLEMRYGDQVREEVVSELIEATCAEAIKEQGLDVVTSPRLIQHELDEQNRLHFEAMLDVRPVFELKPYKGLAAERRVVRVSEEDVDKALASLRERFAILETEEDRVNVAQGDVIVADLEAFCDGQPLAKGTGQGVQIEVGSGRLPEQLEKQLVGVTRGIRTPILVRFEHDHPDPDLAGKLVRFDVTVREIKNKILPALDDEFAAEVGIEGCQTLADLRAKIREDLERREQADADRRMRNEVLAALVEAHEFEVPEALVEDQLVRMLRDMGVTEVPEDKVGEVRQALEPAATRQVRAGFILDAIADAEGIEVAEDELREAIKRQLAAAGSQIEAVQAYYRRPGAVAALRRDLRRDKALDRVVELATRRDVEVDRSQVADTR